MTGLNPQQHEAATCGTGPRLILAGPGTGKTTTLVARLTHLVQSGVPAQRVLAVTFTRKAGEEMSARLRDQLGSDGEAMSVGTFHSFALRLLREFGEAAGLPSYFKVLDEQGQRSLLMSLKIFWSPDHGIELPEIFAYAKSRMMDPKAFTQHVKAKQNSGELKANDPFVQALEHYGPYQKALLAQAACDFEDLIFHTVNLLEGQPKIAKEIAARFDHILVDEFQDVNQGQFRLLQGLLQNHQNLWCVGDDDQSIYAFRGADASYTLRFQKHFPKAVLHHLQENYRSSHPIVGLADFLIRANRERHAKVLTSVQGSGPPVVVIPFPDMTEEARWICDAAAKVLEKGIPPREIAVLFRVSQQAFALQLAFQEAKIPCSLQGAGDFWEMVPARYLRGMLLLAANPRDTVGRRLLGEGRRGEEFAKRAKALPKQEFRRQVGRIRDILADDPPFANSLQKAADWSDRVMAASSAALRLGSVEALEEWVTESVRSRRQMGKDVISLSTIHGAKGLEWHTVFLAGFEADLLPHILAQESLEEERRLAYVALTRAKRFLCLSYCENRYDKQSGPSGFLSHLLKEAPAELYVRRGEPKAQTEEPKTKKQPQKAAQGSTTAAKIGTYKFKSQADNESTGAGQERSRKWTNVEEKKLVRQWHSGKSLAQLAQELGRSQAAIQSRMQQLGLDVDERLAQNLRLEAIEDLALEVMDHGQLLKWMEQPHPKLDGAAPYDIAGTPIGYRKVRSLLQKLAQSKS